MIGQDEPPAKTKNIPFRKIPKVGKDETMLGMLLAMGDTIPS